MANNGDRLDLNSMYSILGDIFNRYLNENYRSGNRSNFAQGLADLRNGWSAWQNDKKNKRDQREYKNSMGNGGNNQYANGTIGATGDGIYGVNSMPPQPNSGGIGVDANGVYGIGVGQQPNQSMFRGGNFDWGNTQMPNGNSVMDAWNSPQQNSMFSGIGNRESDHGMNITDQTIGQNYNNRIDGQVGGLNIPQSPQGGDGNLDKLLTTSGLDILTGKDGGTFSSVLNGFGGLFGGSGLNPYYPSNSSSNLAQSIEGQNVSANDLSRYLGSEYNRAMWIQNDMENNGVTNPLISMLRYDTKIAPLVQRAREDRLKDLFMRSNNRDLSDEERMEARLQLAGELQDPEFMDKMEYNKWKRQKEMDEWDLDRIGKDIKNRAAQESLENNRILSDLASAFPDGQVYKVNMGEGYEDEGLRQTNPELVQGLDIINTYARNKYGKDFTVTGGWRSKENNAKNNGHPNSHHLYGEAVDLVDSGLTPEQRDDIVRFAKAIGFNSVLYHDAGSGNHLHLALEKGTHLKGLNIGKGKTLTVNQMLGQTTTKDSKNKKETGSKYDSQKLADMINSTYTEGKKHASDAERGQIGDYMSTMVGRFVDPNKAPKDSYMEAAEGLYDYYHNVAGANKGWSLNSEEFSHLVARAVHKYYIDNFGIDIPIQYIDRPLFAKFDTQSQGKIEDAKKAEEANKGKPKTVEEEAKQVLVGNGQGATSQQPQKQKPKAGSKLANDLNQPITFNGIMSGTKGVADKLRVNPNQYTDPSLTWHW